MFLNKVFCLAGELWDCNGCSLDYKHNVVFTKAAVGLLTLIFSYSSSQNLLNLVSSVFFFCSKIKRETHLLNGGVIWGKSRKSPPSS